MDRIHKQPADQRHKRSLDPMVFKALLHLVIHPHRISEMAETQARHLHLDQERAHLATKHTVTAALSINHHLVVVVVVVHKQIHSVVQITWDQMLEPMQAAMHTINTGQVKYFSVNAQVI